MTDEEEADLAMLRASERKAPKSAPIAFRTNIGPVSRDNWYWQTATTRYWFETKQEARESAQDYANANKCAVRVWRNLVCAWTATPALTPYEKAMEAIDRGLAAQAANPQDWRNKI